MEQTKLEIAWHEFIVHKPYNSIDHTLMVHEAFNAGAAAMAEIFASGQGLRIDQKTTSYRIFYDILDKNEKLEWFDLKAYSAQDAKVQGQIICDKNYFGPIVKIEPVE